MRGGWLAAHISGEMLELLAPVVADVNTSRAVGVVVRRFRIVAPRHDVFVGLVFARVRHAVRACLHRQTFGAIAAAGFGNPGE